MSSIGLELQTEIKRCHRYWRICLGSNNSGLPGIVLGETYAILRFRDAHKQAALALSQPIERL